MSKEAGLQFEPPRDQWGRAAGTWMGRKGDLSRCRHSFNAFVAEARKTRSGREHLWTHHRIRTQEPS